MQFILSITRAHFMSLLHGCRYLGFFGALFIPVDIADTYSDPEGPTSMQQLWLSVYWITFVLTWAVLPIVNEYHASGYYHWKDALLSSLKSNLIQYVVMLVLGAIFIVWVLASKKLNAA